MINQINQQQVRQLISNFQAHDHFLPFSVVDTLQPILLRDKKLILTLNLPYIASSTLIELQSQVSQVLSQNPAIEQIIWEHNYTIVPRNPVNSVSNIRGVRNIIAISSGKGGVGKSSIAVNLALAFAHFGLKVGIVDGDIYGPSVPSMLGAQTEIPVSFDGKLMQPIMKYNIASHSIGYLLQQEEAVMWRGPMASKALLQILNDTVWPDLDYLFIDMPPGTGDIQLTLAKNIPVNGVVIVTTPQKIAWLDTLRGMMMLRQLNIPILGVVENMAEYICSVCGTHDTIFGDSYVAMAVQQYHSTLLGKLPLHRWYREDLDEGHPTVVKRPDSELTQYYFALAQKVSEACYQVPQSTDIAIKMVD